ncbi:hypothetical protein [Lichenibacterium dinghuense]|uniref:hypothetical protein n=1 Tax=Lichenibacterium dinghuense TaxID=2895977 RepID=UPI001F3F1F9F|nr:hypothetical protein [Lichenibacterium sp. 6Y81]
MMLTVLQANVLQNLDRIEMTRSGGKSRYSLDGRDCRPQIIGLAAQGAVKWDGHGRPARVATSEDITIRRRVETELGDPG